jgi:ferrous iron transport protein A
METILNFRVRRRTASLHVVRVPSCCNPRHVVEFPGTVVGAGRSTFMNAAGCTENAVIALSEAPTGAPMTVTEVLEYSHAPEWAQRLRELGFIDGEAVCVLRRGQPGGEPLAVRVGVSTFALRRAEAACILVAAASGAVR